MLIQSRRLFSSSCLLAKNHSRATTAKKSISKKVHEKPASDPTAAKSKRKRSVKKYQLIEEGMTDSCESPKCMIMTIINTVFIIINV